MKNELKTYSVDSSKPVTMEIIMECNEDFPPDTEEIKSMESLNVNDACCVGMVEVKRIS